MNILTVTYNSDFYYIRPDISLNRDSNDYFCPDGITEITVAPFLYIRIDKAGKAVNRKFAPRYYSSIGYGINLTAASIIDKNAPQSFLTANSLDNSTYVSKICTLDEFEPEILLESLQQFCKSSNVSVPEDVMEVLSGKENIVQLFNTQLEKITRLTSVRTGDFIAVELAPHSPAPIDSAIQLGEIKFTIK